MLQCFSEPVVRWGERTHEPLVVTHSVPASPVRQELYLSAISRLRLLRGCEYELGERKRPGPKARSVNSNSVAKRRGYSLRMQKNVGLGGVPTAGMVNVPGVTVLVATGVQEPRDVVRFADLSRMNFAPLPPV